MTEFTDEEIDRMCKRIEERIGQMLAEQQLAFGGGMMDFDAKAREIAKLDICDNPELVAAISSALREVFQAGCQHSPIDRFKREDGSEKCMRCDVELFGPVVIVKELDCQRELAEAVDIIRTYTEGAEERDAELRRMMVLRDLADNEDKVDVTHPFVKRARAFVDKHDCQREAAPVEAAHRASGARHPRVEIIQGEQGLFYATSPEVKGLLVIGNTAAEAVSQILPAIEEMKKIATELQRECEETAQQSVSGLRDEEPIADIKGNSDV